MEQAIDTMLELTERAAHRFSFRVRSSRQLAMAKIVSAETISACYSSFRMSIGFVLCIPYEKRAYVLVNNRHNSPCNGDSGGNDNCHNNHRDIRRHRYRHNHKLYAARNDDHHNSVWPFRDYVDAPLFS